VRQTKEVAPRRPPLFSRHVAALAVARIEPPKDLGERRPLENLHARSGASLLEKSHSFFDPDAGPLNGPARFFARRSFRQATLPRPQQSKVETFANPRVGVGAVAIRFSLWFAFLFDRPVASCAMPKSKDGYKPTVRVHLIHNPVTSEEPISNFSSGVLRANRPGLRLT
jgi:hypothetical protein